MRVQRTSRSSERLRGFALAALFIFIGAPLVCAAAPRWLRDPALSPDGQRIAFRSNGDLYIAVVRTGETRVLRETAAHETKPVWLPDGSTIAFAADTYGSYDVFTITADRVGEPTRLTWHERHEMPVGAAPDGKSLLVRSGRLDIGAAHVYPFQLEDTEDESWPVEWTGIFSLPITGGAARPLIEPASHEAAWDTSGERLIFSVRPSSETVYRKHERSPGTWDIWLREPDGRTFRPLTTFDGHDTTPAWNPADQRIYFLSERSGSFNLWRMPLAGDAYAEPVTHHVRHPVRGLSVAASGDLAYSFRGEIYCGRPGGAIERVPVRLPSRGARSGADRLDASASIREAVLAPQTGEAIVVARGEVYAIDRKSNRRRALFIGHEGVKSSPTLTADGRRLLVVHDLGSRSELLLTALPRSARAWIDGSAAPRATAFASSSELIQRAALSPDGTQAAFTSGGALKLANVADGSVRVLARYSDGMVKADQPLRWHPAGRHIAMEWSNLQRRELEIAVLDTRDGTVLNVSRSGFADTAPGWSRDGRALLWLSDRDGLRQFTAEDGPTDVYALFFDPAAQRAYETGGESPQTPLEAAELARLLASLREDTLQIRERRVRLTDTSAQNRAVAHAPNGRQLLRLQGAPGKAELWRTLLPQAEGDRIARAMPRAKSAADFESVDGIEITADGREALVLEGGVARWVDLDGGQSTAIELRDVAARGASGEQRWVFDHVVREVERLYYRPAYLQSIAWRDYVAEYRRWLPAVTHPADFAELMSELLGELNASHTSFTYESPAHSVRSGSLGVRYDPDYRGPGLRIADVLPGSPLAKAADAVRAGDVIVRIGARPVGAGTDPAQLLADSVDQEIALTIESPDGTQRDTSVVPISIADESVLFYRRWVGWRRAETQRLSHGRLGYVHLPWMEEDTFRHLVDEVLGELATKEGIVLDMRFNQGGWLHGPLLAFLSARFAFALQAHGTIFASEPALRAGRPLVVLVNRANYSNGYETPRLLREQQIAKLAGEPIAGTGLGGASTALAYPQFRYGIAHDVSLTADGRYWEGAAQSPDIPVPADRAAERAGRDPQLEAAVHALLRELD